MRFAVPQATKLFTAEQNKPERSKIFQALNPERLYYESRREQSERDAVVLGRLGAREWNQLRDAEGNLLPEEDEEENGAPVPWPGGIVCACRLTLAGRASDPPEAPPDEADYDTDDAVRRFCLPRCPTFPGCRSLPPSSWTSSHPPPPLLQPDFGELEKEMKVLRAKRAAADDEKRRKLREQWEEQKRKEEEERQRELAVYTSQAPAPLPWPCAPDGGRILMARQLRPAKPSWPPPRRKTLSTLLKTPSIASRRKPRSTLRNFRSTRVERQPPGRGTALRCKGRGLGDGSPSWRGRWPLVDSNPPASPLQHLPMVFPCLLLLSSSSFGFVRALCIAATWLPPRSGWKGLLALGLERWAGCARPPLLFLFHLQFRLLSFTVSPRERLSSFLCVLPVLLLLLLPAASSSVSFLPLEPAWAFSAAGSGIRCLGLMDGVALLSPAPRWTRLLRSPQTSLLPAACFTSER